MTAALRDWLVSVGARARTAAGEPIAISDLEAGDYPTIQQLDLSASNLAEVHEGLAQMSGLEILNLSRNQLTEIPLVVLTLTTLRELQLSRNQLRSLDGGIGRLFRLRGLYASRNLIRDLPEDIGSLQELRTLNVRNNRLSRLPAEVFSLARLDELDVSENGISELSVQISNLRQLRNFYISGNDLHSLPDEVGLLPSIESLAISGNQLTALPSTIAKLQNLRSFWVYDNPLSSPPLEIAVRGVSDIRAYFYALDSGAAQLQSRVRILILGPPRVGKTSLVERLTQNSFGARRRETLGVKISRWLTASSSEILLWDFGGQDYMHAAHRFFMAGGEIFIVVVDVRESTSLEYWLQLVKSTNPDARVLVVLNKVDLEARSDVDRRFLSEKYRVVADYFRTSCKSGEGTEQLADRVVEMAAQSVLDRSSARRSVPVTWALVHDRLSHSPSPTISIDGYRELCRSEGCTDATEQTVLLNFLRDIGSIVVLDRAKPWTIITDPQWILDMVYAVITSKFAREAKGIVPEAAVGSILLDAGVSSPRDVSLVRDSLVDYDFALRLPEGVLVIPDLLPEIAPQDIDVPETEVVRHTISVDGDPSFLHARSLVRLATDVMATKAWRRGALLRSSAVNASALVIADERDRQIRLRCWGPDRISYLGFIRLMIRSVASAFGDISIAEHIPVDDGRSTVEYDEILGLYLMGERELVLGKAGVRRDIQALLFGVNNQGGRLLMSGPVYNFDRSAVSFGAGHAFNINSGEMKSVVAQLVRELESTDDSEGHALAQEISEAAVANDRSRLATAARAALAAFSAAAPIAELANSVLSLMAQS
ncbi:GTP-binding protein [Micromonospora sp. WMMC241]|uniref:leucine-rich repeat domain-containing protein n=1 Tax=Micromonospora sp. WMMC241 TaxID=3015159 RepID=UPI0022B67F64|nr:COR domain-containing protein [Micromonospora sp. WMMC241]MCZ7439432.1 GTP-binding protein [Micromonospora sp. WMMC241]